jgi:pyocin large subunit-like protein
VLSILLIVAAIVVRAFQAHLFERPVPATARAPVAAPAAAPVSPRLSTSIETAVGFRSPERLEEHFAKHGREFRALSAGEYLGLAQQLRDRPAGGDVLELVRSDGVTCRFDRSTGAFLAFNADRTIRTFFRPNNGEEYFRRQASRPGDAQ